MAGEETLGLPGVRQRQRIQFLGPERDSEGRFTYGKIESVSRVEQCEWHCGAEMEDGINGLQWRV